MSFLLGEVFTLFEKNQPQKITFYVRIVCNNIKPNYWRCGLLSIVLHSIYVKR